MSVRKQWLVLALVGALAIVLVAPAIAMGVPGYMTQWGTAGSGDSQFNGPYEVAADGLGGVYVGDYGNQRVQKFNSTGTLLTQWSTAPDFPEGVRVSRTNGIAIASWGTNKVTIRNATTGAVILTVGTGANGTGPGDFDNPESVAFDRYGFIYVTDATNHRVQKFFPSGAFMMQWGSAGTGPGKFDHPYGIDVDPLGYVYVTDYAAGNVQKFTSTGGFVTMWGTFGSSDGQFQQAAAVNVGQDGNIYVTDADPAVSRVQAFTPNGAFLFKFGSPGAGNGQFSRPWGITSDGTGIYVSELNNDRVQKFSLTSAKMTTRVGGANRYDVAVNLVSQRWPGLVGIKDVIVVCGEDRAMADPLGVAGLASIYDAPVLMTKSTSLMGSTQNMLKAIVAVNGPISIHVIGGTRSIPKAIYNKIAATNPAGGIERINGVDRYELSANMALRMKQVADAKGVTIPGVMLFNAQNPAAWYDALAAGPLSAGGLAPMLALRNTSIPGPVVNVMNGALAGKPRFVVNSTAYVPASVYTASGAIFRFSNTTNRAASAVQIGFWGRVGGWVGLKYISVANKLPDALTGGSFVGEQGGILLYSDLAGLPTATANAVPIVKVGSQQGYVFGGPASVSDAAIAQFNTLLNTP